jgi:hypothetical protein
MLTQKFDHNRNLTILSFMALVICALICSAAQDYGYSEAVLDSWGGTLTVGKMARMVVPEGALSEETLMSIEVRTDGESCLEFHFQPHGLQFNVPVEIQLSWATLKGFELDDLALYYYDEDSGELIEETEVVFDEKTKQAILSLDHFSYYYFPRR